APSERFRDVFLTAQSAAQLTGNAGRLHNAPHTFTVDGMTLPRPVEIHQMQIGCSLLDPAAGHGGGIVAEDGLLSVIALAQSHTLAASQIDRRQDQHRRKPPMGAWRTTTGVSRHCKGTRSNLQGAARFCARSFAA